MHLIESVDYEKNIKFIDIRCQKVLACLCRWAGLGQNELFSQDKFGKEKFGFRNSLMRSSMKEKCCNVSNRWIVLYAVSRRTWEPEALPDRLLLVLAASAEDTALPESGWAGTTVAKRAKHTEKYKIGLRRSFTTILDIVASTQRCVWCQRDSMCLTRFKLSCKGAAL